MAGASRPAQLAILAALHEGMGHVVDDLAGRAQRIAPVEEGTLRDSVTTDVVVIGGVGVEGTVAFTVPYAAAQHEHVEYHHPKGGQAKYLEGPLKENASRYTEVLAATVRARTRL